MDWKPYDPSWLVALAQRLRPDDAQLAAGLGQCTEAASDGSGYLYFVDPGLTGGNRESPWAFDHSIELRDPAGTTVVLDVLKNGRIGGVDVLDGASGSTV
ncbi:MAG: hypothetical protein KDD44_04305 [Bdellovibrionales bacterium]|nr:hypothetical protein [Bdellovibrionales bacterium]